MIRFNANLFRIAAFCQSKEETRYYLCGVLVEPHPIKGVNLVATDGHCLIAIHDENGFADETAIISLGTGLKECRNKKRDFRTVTIGTREKDAEIHRAFDESLDAPTEPVARVYGVRIDGTFPDYRRVVPGKFTDRSSPFLAGLNVARFGEIGADLANHAHGWTARDCGLDRKDSMRLLAEDCENPTAAPMLVLWPLMPFAFGMLMPTSFRKEASLTLPTWFTDAVPKAA
jgi:hypothetical protein